MPYCSTCKYLTLGSYDTVSTGAFLRGQDRHGAFGEVMIEMAIEMVIELEIEFVIELVIELAIK